MNNNNNYNDKFVLFDDDDDDGHDDDNELFIMNEDGKEEEVEEEEKKSDFFEEKEEENNNKINHHKNNGKNNHNNNNNSNEIGFIFLENCNVLFVDDVPSSSSSSSSPPETKNEKNSTNNNNNNNENYVDDLPIGKWLNVNLLKSTRNNNNTSSSSSYNEEQKEQRSNDDDDDVDDNKNFSLCCHQCNLIIQQKKETSYGKFNNSNSSSLSLLEIDLSKASKFDGTTIDMISSSSLSKNSHDDDNKKNENEIITTNNNNNDDDTSSSYHSCCCNNNNTKKNRSDASLIFGLLKTCQNNYNHINIERIGIISHNNNNSNSNNNNNEYDYDYDGDDHKEEEEGVVRTKTRIIKNKTISLLITFSIPQLVNNNNDNIDNYNNNIFHMTTNDNKQKRKRSSLSSSFLLPQSTQLLLSIMRSDWYNLDKQMNNIQNMILLNISSLSSSSSLLTSSVLSLQQEEEQKNNQYDIKKQNKKKKQQQEKEKQQQQNYHCCTNNTDSTIIVGTNNSINEEGVNNDDDRNESENNEVNNNNNNSNTNNSSDHRVINKTFFPSALSLNDLYDRIRGSNSKKDSSTNYRTEENCSCNGSTTTTTTTTNTTAAAAAAATTQSTRNSSSSSSSSSLLLKNDIPIDIIQYKITPYLKSKSLDSLRRTCTYYYIRLNYVVPGLNTNIKLYKHQIKSLSWMRHREITTTTTTKIFSSHSSCSDNDHNNNNNNNNNNNVSSLLFDCDNDNDTYRSKSGGTISCLSFRPKRTTKQQQQQRQQQLQQAQYEQGSGSGLSYNSNNRIATTTPSRHASRSKTTMTTTMTTSTASPTHKIYVDTQSGNITNPYFLNRDSNTSRGGLLCDDPGLGKTITVLSLILQTFGLSTQQNNNNNINTNNEQQEEEEVEEDITTISKRSSSDDEGNNNKNKNNLDSLSPLESYEDRIFTIYWNDVLAIDTKQRELEKILLRLRKENYDADSYFYESVDPELDDCSNYYDIIKNPMCLRDIYKKVGNMTTFTGKSNSKKNNNNNNNINNEGSTSTPSSYSTNFELFVQDVELCFDNARIYNPVDHPVHNAANILSNRFHNYYIKEFKKHNVRCAESKPNIGSKFSSYPNNTTTIASIIQERQRIKKLNSLIPSSSTLLVVPNTLVNHWQEQINLHLNPKYCTEKIPITFHYKQQRSSSSSNISGRSSTWRSGSNNELSMSDVLYLCNVKKTHFPLLFIDSATTKPLPSPTFMAMFRIVITTNQRLSNEWKNGTFDSDLDNNYDDNGSSSLLDESSHHGQIDSIFNPTFIKSCSLLQIHWLRLIVDEGHSMGRGSKNNAIQFASWIEAQRRWAMTGTPTPQTLSQSGLSNLLGLIKFLNHGFFSDNKVWQHYIARPWNEGNMVSFFRLKSLLSLLMVRHTKRDIEELSPPQTNRIYSVMSKEEITAYNTLASAIQHNLITTAMEGKTSGKIDSLLHRRQAKHARLALSNVRLACSGGTHVIPTLTQKYWDELLFLLGVQHGVRGVKLDVVRNFLHRAVTEQLSSCHCCGLQLSTLMVLTCGDLICTECIDSNSQSCPVCDMPFDPDDFQRLQPGFVYEWKWNLEEAKKEEVQRQQHRSSSTDGQQASNDGSIGNEETTGNSIDVEARNADVAGAVALQPAQARTRRTRRPGDGHKCEYTPGTTDGKCILCLEEHDGCVMTKMNMKCNVCYRVPERCPEEESKFFYVIKKLEKLLASQSNDYYRTSASNTASRLIGENVDAKDQRRLKVIIFSQFRPILNLIGHRLLRRFGAGCVAEYWGYARKQELAKFSKENDCFVMLLGRDGSEGLDLSFVTHIIFLDEVYDKSVENQVISRAYRMGAQGSVQVETLVSCDSVEETMTVLEDSMTISGSRQFRGRRQQNIMVPGSTGANNDDDGMEDVCSVANSGTTTKEYQSAKLQFLLKNLCLIKNDCFTRFSKKIINDETNGNKRKFDSLVESPPPLSMSQPAKSDIVDDPQKKAATSNRAKKVRFVVI